MADSSLDTQIRAELLVHLRPLAVAAVTRLEGATTDVEFHAAAADVQKIKRWIDWLNAAGTGRGSRVS